MAKKESESEKFQKRIQKAWEDFREENESPTVGDVIVGFSGLDPQKKDKDDVGTEDHEKLSNLKGGDESGHYHLTREQYERLLELLEEGNVLPDIYPGQSIFLTVDEAMTPYEVRGVNVTLS